MRLAFSKVHNSQHRFLKVVAALSVGAFAVSIPANAQEPELEAGIHFFPGNLVVSRSVYDDNANNVKVGALLPPNCANTVGPCVRRNQQRKVPLRLQ